MKQRQSGASASSAAGSSQQSPASEQGASNEAARQDLGQPTATPSILSGVSGGAGLHAGACGCASCLGGGVIGKHPDFTEVLADGTVVGSEAVAAESLGSGQAAPDLSGAGEAAQAGSWQFGRHPDFPNVYGQTWYNASDLPSAPTVSWEVSRNVLPWKPDYTVTVKPTTAGTPSFPVIAIPENNDGYLVKTPAPGYEGLDHYVIVGNTAATNIAAAEDQHVRDLDHGWYLAAIKLADAVNAAAAGEGFMHDDPAQAKRDGAARIVASLGAYGQTIQEAVVSGGSMSSPVEQAMNKAFGATKSVRDGTGAHSFPLELYTAHHDQNKVASKVDEDKALDQTSEATVVTFDKIA